MASSIACKRSSSAAIGIFVVTNTVVDLTYRLVNPTVDFSAEGE